MRPVSSAVKEGGNGSCGIVGDCGVHPVSSDVGKHAVHPVSSAHVFVRSALVDGNHVEGEGEGVRWTLLRFGRGIETRTEPS